MMFCLDLVTSAVQLFCLFLEYMMTSLFKSHYVGNHRKQSLPSVETFLLHLSFSALSE